MTDAQTDRMGEELRTEVERAAPPTSNGVMYRVGYWSQLNTPVWLKRLFPYSGAKDLTSLQVTSMPNGTQVHWFAEPVEWEEHKTVPVIGSHIDISAESFGLLKTADQLRMFVVMYLTNDSVVGEVRVVGEDSEFDWMAY